jgi:Flp pilus assembly protein TadD
MCRHDLLRAAAGALLLIGWVASADAQTGRVFGTVKDERGQAIKGATIRGENDESSLNLITATTDEKGRFAIIGLRSGLWMFTVGAPGFESVAGQYNVRSIGDRNPTLAFTLRRREIGASSPAPVLATRDLQQDLLAADSLYNQQKYDDAIVAYRAIMAKAPSLSVINLQIAAAYRSKKDYDNALATYNDLLKADPDNDKAKVGIGMTNLEKGDFQAADEMLSKAAASGNPTREVLYNLGEVKFARGEVDASLEWFRKAAVADPNWGKPLFRIGTVALNKGDRDAAVKMMERAIAVDPLSPEAAQAQTLLNQLRK